MMNKMIAAKFDAWLLTKTSGVAYGTVFVFVNIESIPGSTFRLEAWQTLGFISYTTAMMSAVEHLSTRLFDQILTLFGLAYVLKGLSAIEIQLFELFVTVPTYNVVQLLTGLSKVIRLFPAKHTEILLAFITPNPIVSHVLRCFG